MRKLLLLAPFLCVFATAHAQPPDQKALPDGGSIVQSADGGSLVTVDTGQTNDWIAALTPRSNCGSPSVYYLFSTGGTAATSSDFLIQVDRPIDVPITQGNGEKYRYLSFLGEDGGVPCVSVHKNAR